MVIVMTIMTVLILIITTITIIVIMILLLIINNNIKNTFMPVLVIARNCGSCNGFLKAYKNTLITVQS